MQPMQQELKLPVVWKFWAWEGARRRYRQTLQVARRPRSALWTWEGELRRSQDLQPHAWARKVEVEMVAKQLARLLQARRPRRAVALRLGRLTTVRDLAAVTPLPFTWPFACTIATG